MAKKNNFPPKTKFPAGTHAQKKKNSNEKISNTCAKNNKKLFFAWQKKKMVFEMVFSILLV